MSTPPLKPGATRRELLAGGAAAVVSAAIPGVARAADPLRRALGTRLVTPGDPRFAAAFALHNPRLIIRPRAIAFCESVHDVQACVRYARKRRWPISARSGRHSFAGYSNCHGLVADVSHLDHVVYNPGSRTVRVGAGANTLDVYKNLVLAHDVAIPHGTCPTVGIAGLTLGGGIGLTMRRYGLTLDNLLGLEIVLADGRALHTDAHHFADLFWACRGGGGGNFGIVTEFTFAVHDTEPVTDFGMTFDWSAAPAALDAWQTVAPHADDRLAHSLFRAMHTPSGLSATTSGQFFGSKADAQALLAPLLAVGPKSFGLTTVPYARSIHLDACNVDAAGTVTCNVARAANYQRSNFVNEPLSRAGIDAILRGIEAWPADAGAIEGGVLITAFGPCAINRVPANATAFVHRDSLMHILSLSQWGPQSSASRHIQWMRQFSAAIRPSASGYAYQNYIDAELHDWRHAYYGSNYARLHAIQRRYDPHRLFRFRQGIGS